MKQEDLSRATILALKIVGQRGRDTQPVHLSEEETYLLASSLILVNNRQKHRMEALPQFGGNLVHLNHLRAVLDSDLEGIESAEQSYDGSWKRRGGTGAFMMLARKWDRLEARVAILGYNVFAAIRQDKRREGVIDDVRDLRRYLTLVECEMVEQGAIKLENTTKDTVAAD